MPFALKTYYKIVENQLGGYPVSLLCRVYNGTLNNKHLILQVVPEENKVICRRPDDSRYRTRLGRLLTSHYKGVEPEWFNEGIIHKFVEDYFKYEPPKIKYLKGDEIIAFYEKAASLGLNSCMTGSRAEYTALYAINPDKVQLAVMQHGNSAARCLVWNDDDNNKVFDRIYTTDGSMYNLMVSAMQDDGYSATIYESGHKANVTLDIKGLKTFPYADSLRYVVEYEENDTMIISTDDTKHIKGELNSQHGEIEGIISRSSPCVHCAEYHDNEEMIEDGGDMWCEVCHDDHFFCCECCDETRHTDYLFLVEDQCLCVDCYQNNAALCDDCNERFFEDHLTSNDNGVFCTSCLPNNLEEEGEPKDA